MSSEAKKKSSTSSTKSAALLAGFLTFAGTMHFTKPKMYDRLVPKQLPGAARTWTNVSGVAEIAIGAAIAVPKTRRLGGLAAAALFIAVLPANVKGALDVKSQKGKAIMYARLPLQIPLIMWALKARNAGKQQIR